MDTPVKIDKTDKKIIKILQENCKITNLELSKRIGLSPAPTLERVKKLESLDVLSSYHAVVNPKTIGLDISTFVLVNIAWQKTNALTKFIEKINEIEEIVECHIITGEADALLKIMCKDIESYEALLFNTISKISEVERIKTLMTLSNVKESHILPYKYE